MMKNLGLFVMCSLLMGCALSQPLPPRPEWKALTGEDSKAALAALHSLDGQIQAGMTLSEVESIFPRGVLIKCQPWDKKYSFVFRLRSDLHQAILGPHSYGAYDYWISFGKDKRVVHHMVMLGGDI